MIKLDAWVIGTAAAVVGAYSFATAWTLNFREFTNEDQPYVYVQTLPDIYKLLDPLGILVPIDPANYPLVGYVMTPDHHPLPWLLGDFTRIHLFDPEDMPDPID